MNFREEGEIGSKNREEGEIGSESREKGDLPPCSTHLITLHYSLLHSYVRLRRFEAESGVSFPHLQHVTHQDFWVVKGGHHVFNGSHNYSGVTVAPVYVGYYNAFEFGEARF